MVAFDDGGIAGAAFDDVGVDGALGQEVDGADFSAFVFEDADEFFADDFSFLFGLGDAFQAFEEAVFGIDADKVHARVFKGGFHFVAFVFAHEAVVDEDAAQVFADGIDEEFRTDGGVHAAGEGEEDFFVADFFLDGALGLVGEVVHVPVSFGATCFFQEVVDDFVTVFGVVDFAVELDGVDVFFSVFHGGHGAAVGGGHGAEAFGEFFDVVHVAHPGGLFHIQAVEEFGCGVHHGFGFTEFPLVGFGDGAAHVFGDKLHAVADA